MAARFGALVPVLETDRLILRAPCVEDVPDWSAIFAPDDDFLGTPMDAEEAFANFATYVGGWMLNGHGIWTMTLRGDGTRIGFTMVGLEWGDAEPELGWMLLPAYRGHGYATEAADAARDHAFSLFGPGETVSYIDAGNIKSARVAQKLSANRDYAEEARLGLQDVHVWRHGAHP